MTAAGESTALTPVDGDAAASLVDDPPSGTVAVPAGLAARDVLRMAWLASCASANTHAAYSGDIGQFFDWCDRAGVDVVTARRHRIDEYGRWLRGPQPTARRGRYGNATVARKLTAVSSFYTYAVDEGVLTANPAARTKRPKVATRSTTRALSVEEGEALLDAAAAHSSRAHAIVDLMLSTALRTSEVVGADVEDLFRDGPDLMLHVVRKGDVEDDMLVPAGAAVTLRGYLAGRGAGPLFVSEQTGDRVTRQQLGHLITLLARRAGLVDRDLGDRLVSPHCLRHAAATAALDLPDVDLRLVQKMLRHKDLRTTELYDHATVEADRAASRAVDGVWHRGARASS